MRTGRTTGTTYTSYRNHDGWKPTLTWSPYAFAKINFMMHNGDVEIAGFAISSKENPFYVYDFVMIPQNNMATNVEFQDDEIAIFQDRMMSEGIEPVECTRIWCHTHPNMSANPSGVDESNFKDNCGDGDWAIMFIVSKTNDIYARLKYRHPITGDFMHVRMDVVIDWASEFYGSSHEEWEAEYNDNVNETKWLGYSWSSNSKVCSQFRNNSSNTTARYKKLRVNELLEILEKNSVGSVNELTSEQLADIRSKDGWSYDELMGVENDFYIEQIGGL